MKMREKIGHKHLPLLASESPVMERKVRETKGFLNL